MGVAIPGAAVGLAVAGTLVVYNVDRIRDVERDARTAPARSRFVRERGGGLALLVLAGALAAAGFGVAAGPRAAWVLAPVLAAGLLHRRLKQFAFAKSLYLTAAWLSVCVGLPAVLEPGARHVASVSCVLGAPLLANAVASSVRDREAGTLRIGEARALRLARLAALAGLALALTASPDVRPLAWIPGLTLAALLGFRPDERYGHLVVDGSLLAGAWLSLGC